jgi:hypothetical protein
MSRHSPHNHPVEATRHFAVASVLPPRLMHVPGLFDARGEPVLALSAGTRHRPTVRALVTLTALHHGGGAA